VVDSEDALLRILLAVGHPSLLGHIQWEFVSSASIAALFEDPASCDRTKSLNASKASLQKDH
jgi:hypothetical protein